MRVGATVFMTDRTWTMRDLAVEVESRGLASLWVTEKTHVPTSRRTRWPGGELPEWYLRTYDPFVALAAAAAVTTTLRVGTGVSLVPIHDPVILAKQVASLDHLSAGRFDFGVGYGWNAEEFETHGVTLESAPDRLRDALALMRRVWSDDVAAYAGPVFRLEPSWSWPKPIQVPGPPVWFGCRASYAAFEDIALHGDGWLPIEGYGQVVAHVGNLRAVFERHGRDPAEARIAVYSSGGDPATLESYAAAGVEQVVLSLPPADRDRVLRALDAFEPVVQQAKRL